jgi:hypothetical protein
MEGVEMLNSEGITNAIIQEDPRFNLQHLTYLDNLTGATSKLPARQERYNALKIELLG